MATKKDPTEAMRLQASRYPEVDQGTACTQSSFKTGKTAFLYVGMQGGRYKAMFKLGPSAAQAAQLAEAEPDRFEVGSTSWVTARFTADKPMPKRLWSKWLDESYELSRKGGAAKNAKKKATKKSTAKSGKKTTKKSAVSSKKKKTTRKSTAKKASAKRKTSASRKNTTRKKTAR